MNEMRRNDDAMKYRSRYHNYTRGVHQDQNKITDTLVNITSGIKK